MNTTLISTRHLSLKSIFRFWKSKEKAPVPIEKTERRPQPVEVNKENAVYDQITHTGQAWDQADYRHVRFTIAKKQVNPNIAAHLIAEQAPIASKEQIVSCDGGHPGLGHPRVYINLDKPGTHACGYCGIRFYNIYSTKPEQMDIAHIQV